MHKAPAFRSFDNPTTKLRPTGSIVIAPSSPISDSQTETKMLFVNAGLALVLAYLAEAAPNPERRTVTPKYNVLVTDTYDGLGRTPPVFVPGLQPQVTQDQGVLYNNTLLSTTSDATLSGLKPESSPNFAVFVQPPTSAATTGLCYQPKELYFGCQLRSKENAAGVNVPCKLTLTGHDNVKARDVGSQTFSFTPSGVLAPVMQAQIDLRKLGPSSVVRFSSQLDLDPIAAGGLLTSLLEKLGLADLTNALLVTKFDDFSYVQYDIGDYRNCGLDYKR
ncbi:hypothetical protein KC363_g7632 [Hortaea werneckii]|nr:hypothetical protein KC361_g8847 [Hortaea werneckii]KAI6877969.1 hypothetical protein KC325_g8921 [Hortaea werneckii]KAI6986542.1 hypothetical protein KC359_g8700 [Hortaea werneckii]KAI7140265.1 hypothetical protein KC344_g8830 [Hortaea werneckii]KAI7166923.1 hypothetical protein KC360_g8958 [Hortaea werneckii]